MVDYLKLKMGQINPDSMLGKIIMEFVSREDIINILDIGTWNGLGTTKCIRDSIIENNKNDYNVVSLEFNKEFYDIALKNNYPLLDNFNIVYGRIVSFEDLSWLNYEQLRNDQKQWFVEDKINLERAPDVSDVIPEVIDLLILDGGEFSTYPEFVKLKDKSKIIILDDSNMLKCLKIKKEIKESNSYKILYDVEDDRNGFFIVENILI